MFFSLLYEDVNGQNEKSFWFQYTKNPILAIEYRSNPNTKWKCQAKTESEEVKILQVLYERKQTLLFIIITIIII